MPTGSETVTIPREYLQHLLKKEHVDDFNSLPISLAQLPSPHLFHMDYITAESHENGKAQEDYPQQAACSSEEDEYTMSLHPAAKGTLRKYKECGKGMKMVLFSHTQVQLTVSGLMTWLRRSRRKRG